MLLLPLCYLDLYSILCLTYWSYACIMCVVNQIPTGCSLSESGILTVPTPLVKWSVRTSCVSGESGQGVIGSNPFISLYDHTKSSLYVVSKLTNAEHSLGASSFAIFNVCGSVVMPRLISSSVDVVTYCNMANSSASIFLWNNYDRACLTSGMNPTWRSLSISSVTFVA